MPDKVREISVVFSAIKKPTIEEAREIEINAIERLLEMINSHEKIRPYLAEYPFNSKRVSVSISFDDKYGESHFDGSVTYVFIAKNKIFYKKQRR